MSREKPVQTWIHRDFWKKLKIEAAEAEVGVIELTKRLSQSELPKVKTNEKKGPLFKIL